jgi:hypothetical protein
MEVETDTGEDEREEARRAIFGGVLCATKLSNAGLDVDPLLWYVSGIDLGNHYDIFEHISKQFEPKYSVVSITMQPHVLIEGREEWTITLRGEEVTVTDRIGYPKIVGTLRTGMYMMRITVRRVATGQMFVLYRPVDLES